MRGLGENDRRLEILLVQFVTLLREGKAVQMSTRSGEFTTLREVLEEVGPDAARFFYLLRSFHSHLDFDLTLAKTQSAENPVYYIQYVHARICSIFREAEARGTPLSDHPPLSSLTLPDELALMKRWPDSDVVSRPRLREPHRIPSPPRTRASPRSTRTTVSGRLRTHLGLALAKAVKTVVGNGLSSSVTAPERM
jgi:arginyl-tRNA synthetase